MLSRRTVWKIRILTIAVVVVIALIVSRLGGLNFWVAPAIIIGALVLNSFLAEWEDNQPGGFNNPTPEELEKSTDSNLGRDSRHN